MLILATDDYVELLPHYKSLLGLLHNDVNIQAPSLPEGLIRDMSEAFCICGWWKCRAFLVSLGIQEGILNHIEGSYPGDEATDSRLREALIVFQAQTGQEVQDSRQLIQ